jgi:hypothetical protein
MSAGVRMFAGVPVRRAVAAECHAARLACSQVNPEAADLHALFAFPTLRLLDGFNRIQVSTAPVGHDALFACPLFADALRRDARLMWMPATAMPPSPTAAAQRLTDPERTSPAAKIPGRLVSRGAGRRLFARHAGASATSDPVLINPF